AGDTALIDLLAEERVLRDAEDAYVRTHTATAIDLVSLFKALGGGWDAPAPAPDARGHAAGEQPPEAPQPPAHHEGPTGT
ncbi:MAG: efflux transporter outer membrane subunit, partial [Rhodanobacter sp.]